MRNFILATALLLFTGITFAEEATTPVSSNFFTINDLVEDPVTNYTWTVPAKENRTEFKATVIRYNKSAFAYNVFGASEANAGWSQTLSVSYKPGDKPGTYVIDTNNTKNLLSYSDVYEYNSETGKKQFLQRVYYFSVPYTEKSAADIGVLTESIYSTYNQEDPKYFYRVSDQQYFLSFGKATTTSDGTIIKNEDPQIAFGQPLPAPVTTLLIALGFGAAFVMYRNRKQVKA